MKVKVIEDFRSLKKGCFYRDLKNEKALLELNIIEEVKEETLEEKIAFDYVFHIDTARGLSQLAKDRAISILKEIKPFCCDSCVSKDDVIKAIEEKL